MTQFKGTKGKWEVSSDETYSGCYHIKGAKSFDDESNTLLISKAPEMFEMLERIIENYKSGNEDNYLMANLIDKSEQLIKEATEL